MTGVVVFGTGFGCMTHVRALRAAGFDVIGVVGRDPSKTAARARAVDVPHALTSLPDALALPGVDAVTIATPPHTHADIARAALHAGKHVLCEKPFTRDGAEARLLLADATRAGVVHLLGTEFRFDTGQALLARAVRDGMIGDPRLAVFLLHVPVLADSDAQLPDWWADDAQGGGWLGAHGSQVIDQIRVTLGEFDAVTASQLHLAGRPTSADDGFVVHFRLEEGVVGFMASTAADRGPMLVETRVVGTKGSAWIDGLGDSVWVADAHGSRQIEVPPELRTAAASAPPRSLLDTTYEQMIGHGLDFGSYTRLAEHFSARINGQVPPAGPEPATFADGVVAMTVLDAMRRSATTQQTVVVPAP
jgi:predicted dehydrogenase